MPHFIQRPMPPISDRLVERFWGKVQRLGEDACWPWLAAFGRGGYGQFTISGKHLKRDTPYGAHRVAYFLHNLADPAEMFVCHRCDNPKCCNPKHLFLGTPQDNVRDRNEKGRSAAGERSVRNRKNVLAPNVVSQILDWYSRGETAARIGLAYGLSQQTVHAIVSGKNYRYVQRSQTPQPKWQRLGKLTAAQVSELRTRHANGEPVTTLAREFKITHAAAGNAIRRKTYKNI